MAQENKNIPGDPSQQDVKTLPLPEIQEPQEEFVLTWQPIFSEEEELNIKTLWEQKKIDEEQRLLDLQAAEGYIQDLLHTERAAMLIDRYDNNADMKTKSVDSPEDLVTLLRHTIDNEYTSQTSSLPDEEVIPLREFILNLDNTDIDRLHFTASLGRLRKFFPQFTTALATSYPTLDLQVWEFQKIPDGYWNQETTINAIRWFYEKHLNLEKLDPTSFRSAILEVPITSLNTFGLNKAVRRLGYKWTSKAIVESYPELKLRPWEFSHGVTWKGEEAKDTVKQAVKWLIEERLGIAPEDPHFKDKLKLITSDTFNQVGLTPMFHNPEFKSHMRAIIFTYPELNLDINDFSRVPAGTWQSETAFPKATEHIRNIIENQIGLSPDDPEFVEKLTHVTHKDLKVFINRTIFAKFFGNSPYQALNATYPHLGLQPWEIGKVPKGFWGKNDFENVKTAVQWIVREKIKLSQDDKNFKTQLLSQRKTPFNKYLAGMFSSTHLSLLQVFQLAYPDLHITADEFRESNKFRNVIPVEETQQPPSEQVSPEEIRLADEYLRGFMVEE